MRRTYTRLLRQRQHTDSSMDADSKPRDVTVPWLTMWDDCPSVDGTENVQHKGCIWKALATNGDGACALHSVWGLPVRSVDRVELYRKNVREHVLSAVPSSWTSALTW